MNEGTSHLFTIRSKQCQQQQEVALPVVHLPQLDSGPQVPDADQTLAAAAHHLPVVRLQRRDAQLVAVQRGHCGAAAQVKHPHPDPRGERSPP